MGQYEARDGDHTKGNYHVVLPDGRKQTVDYYIDGYSGYVADVKYDGYAKPYDYKHSASKSSYEKPTYTTEYKQQPSYSTGYKQQEYLQPTYTQYSKPSYKKTHSAPAYTSAKPVYNKEQSYAKETTSYEAPKEVYVAKEPVYKTKTITVPAYKPSYVVVESKPTYKPTSTVEYNKPVEEYTPVEYKPYHPEVYEQETNAKTVYQPEKIADSYAVESTFAHHQTEPEVYDDKVTVLPILFRGDTKK